MWLKYLTSAVFLLIAFSRYNANAEVSNAVFPLSKLHQLDENNWEAMLKDEWIVEFYAPWCPACRSLQPTWERLAISGGILGVHVGKVDVTTSPSLSGRFLVSALPTIYHVKNGEFRQYRGSRDVEAFNLFLKDKQWQKLDPVSNWKQPDSIQMSLISQLFKLSHILKVYNNVLYEQYGMPSWLCYSLYTVITMIVSASLGLIFICIIDLFYPPKKAHRESFSESKANIEEIPKDEIEDDEAEQEEEAGDDEDHGKGDEDEDETSDEEKNSHSEDSDDDEETDKAQVPEEDSKAEPEQTDEKSSPRELRKRKPRKAD